VPEQEHVVFDRVEKQRAAACLPIDEDHRHPDWRVMREGWPFLIMLLLLLLAMGYVTR